MTEYHVTDISHSNPRSIANDPSSHSDTVYTVESDISSWEVFIEADSDNVRIDTAAGVTFWNFDIRSARPGTQADIMDAIQFQCYGSPVA